MAFADLIALADRAAQDHLGGVSVVYAPEVGAPVTVVGIFDENYFYADPGQAGVETITPAVFLRLEDLPTDPGEDNPTITIAGQDYTVRQRPTDGIGGAVRLLLRKANM